VQLGIRYLELLFVALPFSIMAYTQPSSPFNKVRKTKKGLSLKRWFKEDWRTPKGKKGYSKGDSGTFRPTKKVSADTPDTYSELSPSDLAAAKAERKAKGRVSRYDRSELKKNKNKNLA
jgi:hypothetical protein